MFRFLIVAALLAPVAVRASDFCETKNFAEVIEQVDAYAQKYGGPRVLLVADIDNTLLTMDQDLGGDAWFEWQSYLLEHEPDSKDLVADNFDGLLEAQGLLFTLGHMHPPEAEIPAMIRQIQSLGVRTLLLTSRGPVFRPQTERELARNGYDFAPTVLPIRGMPTGVFYPYDPDQPEGVGLSREYAQACGLGQPRPASFGAGVFMTSGQHKGAMLRIAMHQADTEVAAVVYVDDHGRHVSRIDDSLDGLEIPAKVFHYQREDVNVNRFKYGDKQPVTAAWRRLQSAIELAFPETEPAPAEAPVAAGH